MPGRIRAVIYRAFARRQTLGWDNLPDNQRGSVPLVAGQVAPVMTPAVPMASMLSRGALQIQRQQFFEDLIVGQVGWPAVGREDRFVELAVGEFELR